MDTSTALIVQTEDLSWETSCWDATLVDISGTCVGWTRHCNYPRARQGITWWLVTRAHYEFILALGI